jgi:hypothetical protein
MRLIFGFQKASDYFGRSQNAGKATVLRLSARALRKHYCLSPAVTGRVVMRAKAEKQGAPK